MRMILYDMLACVNDGLEIKYFEQFRNMYFLIKIKIGSYLIDIFIFVYNKQQISFCFTKNLNLCQSFLAKKKKKRIFY